MTVPEAAMHEDSLFGAWQDDIRRARQITSMESKTLAHPMK